MKKIFVVAPLCAFLTACGSDGGDSSTKTPTTLPTANTATTAPATGATTNTNASTSDTGTTGTGTANPTTGNGTATTGNSTANPTTGNGTATTTTPATGATTTTSTTTDATTNTNASTSDTGTTGTGTANPTTGNGTATTTTPPAEKVYGYKYSINQDSAKAFATKQLGDGAVVDSVTVKVGDKSYLNPFEKDSINLSYLGKGFFVLPATYVLNAHLGDTKLTHNEEDRHALLQQQYSMTRITAYRIKKNGDSDGITDTYDMSFKFDGLSTKQLPTQGTVTYVGKGYGLQGSRVFNNFDKDLTVYDLGYTVDFDSKIGTGALINNSSVLVLPPAPIQQGEQDYYIRSNDDDSSYILRFFGDNAEEIAGVKFGGYIVFGGAKQTK